MFRTKRVYDLPSKEDGFRVLVDRLWPRGMKKEAAKLDLWLKDVAPSDALRKSFHHVSQNWPNFEKKYRSELKKKSDSLATLKKLEKEHGIVTLLFGAKDPEHNQAVVLLQMLKGKK